MRINRRQALTAGSAAAGVGLLPVGASAQASSATLAYGPATAVYALGQIAESKGFFKDEAIDLKLLIGNAGTHGRQSLAAGQAMFAHGDSSHALQLSARGKPCKIIMASQMIASTSTIVIRRDLYDAGITTVEKLADYKRPDGAKPIIAATAIGSGTWLYGTYVFEAKGLGDRINWVAGGGSKTCCRAPSWCASRGSRSGPSSESPRTCRYSFDRCQRPKPTPLSRRGSSSRTRAFSSRETGISRFWGDCCRTARRPAGW